MANVLSAVLGKVANGKQATSSDSDDILAEETLVEETAGLWRGSSWLQNY